MFPYLTADIAMVPSVMAGIDMFPYVTAAGSGAQLLAGALCRGRTDQDAVGARSQHYNQQRQQRACAGFSAC